MFHLASMPAAHGEHIYYGEAISGNTASFFSKFFLRKDYMHSKRGKAWMTNVNLHEGDVDTAQNVQQVITKPATAEKEDYEVGRKIAA